jgi:hypothetical protein
MNIKRRGTPEGVLALFESLCDALAAFQRMTSREKKIAAIRNAGRALEAQAIALIPNIIKENETLSALISTAWSGSLPLIKAFPQEDHARFEPSGSGPIHNLRNWLREAPEDHAIAMGERGMSFFNAMDLVFDRISLGKSAELESYMIGEVAPTQIAFLTIEKLSREHIEARPDFFATFYRTAYEANPTQADTTLARMIDRSEGLASAILLTLASGSGPDASPEVMRVINALSQHQRLAVTRCDIETFMADTRAISAAEILCA